MIVLGLTGSIGMGKSTAADMLRVMGVPVHDSDAVARAALDAGGIAVAEVAALFPQAYDQKKDRIDRALLGPIVFADPQKRRALEAIVHPHVVASQRDFIHAARKNGQAVVVLDIPLLYESGADARVDRVIVVTCPAFLQRRRVLKRPGMTVEKFAHILDSQMPDAIKRCRADYIVQTGLGRGHTFRALKNILQTLTKDAHHDPKRNHFPTLHSG